MVERLLLIFIIFSASSIFGIIEPRDRCVNKLCRGPRSTQSNCCGNYTCEYSYFPATPELKICRRNGDQIEISTIQGINAASLQRTEETTAAHEEADYLDSLYIKSNNSEPEHLKPAEFDPFDQSARLQRIKELKLKQLKEMKKKKTF